jgi:hypothetical protein
VNGTNTCASQHSIRSFRNHGHVNCHRVSLSDFIFLQHIGEFADLLQQGAVSDFDTVAWFISVPNKCDAVGVDFSVAVDTILGDVEGSVFEPGDVAFVETTLNETK